MPRTTGGRRLTPDSIQAWIQDGNDIAEWPFYFAWKPYKSEPVADEKTSLGSLKAMFR